MAGSKTLTRIKMSKVELDLPSVRRNLETLMNAITRSQAGIMIDCTSVHHATSEALSELLRVQSMAEACGKKFMLTGVNSSLANCLRTHRAKNATLCYVEVKQPTGLAVKLRSFESKLSGQFSFQNILVPTGIGAATLLAVVGVFTFFPSLFESSSGGPTFKSSLEDPQVEIPNPTGSLFVIRGSVSRKSSGGLEPELNATALVVVTSDGNPGGIVKASTDDNGKFSANLNCEKEKVKSIEVIVLSNGLVISGTREALVNSMPLDDATKGELQFVFP